MRSESESTGRFATGSIQFENQCLAMKVHRTFEFRNQMLPHALNAIWLVTAECGKSCNAISFVKLNKSKNNQNMLVTLHKNESNNNSLFAITPLQVLAIQIKMNSKGTHYKVQGHKTMYKKQMHICIYGSKNVFTHFHRIREEEGSWFIREPMMLHRHMIHYFKGISLKILI